MSKVVSTHLWNTTKKNLYEQARLGIPFIVGGFGDCRTVCDIGVCCNFLGIWVGSTTKQIGSAKTKVVWPPCNCASLVLGIGNKPCWNLCTLHDVVRKRAEKKNSVITPPNGRDFTKRIDVVPYCMKQHLHG